MSDASNELGMQVNDDRVLTKQEIRGVTSPMQDGTLLSGFQIRMELAFPNAHPQAGQKQWTPWVYVSEGDMERLIAQMTHYLNESRQAPPSGSLAH